MTKRDELLALADRVDGSADFRGLKFGIWPSGAAVYVTSQNVMRMVMDLWNARFEIAAALRARAAVIGDGEA